jgi:hypothetical protein
LAPLLIIAFFIIYTSISSYATIQPYQWFVVFFLLISSSAVFIFFEGGLLNDGKKGSGVVLIAYLVTAALLFHPTVNNVFRSDYWLIKTLFSSMGGLTYANLKSISLFEIFGDIRFQPLAHIVMYLRHLIFQDAVWLYHIFNIILHVITAFLVFLILKRLTREISFAFIFGLLFIALQSQFDTVVWTYHIYIILGAIFFLAATLLTLAYLEGKKPIYLFIAVLMVLLSVFLYEPAIFAPAAIFLVVLFSGGTNEAGGLKKRLVLAGALALAAYIIYFLVTLYGLSLIEKEDKISLAGLLSWRGIVLAVKGVIVNLLQTTFVKNLGASAVIDITDIVYVEFPDRLFKGFTNLIKIALAIFVILMFRFTGAKRRVIPIFILLAVSYIFVISFGRMQSNTIYYLVTQPRYQYFINAVLLVPLGLLLFKKFSDRDRRPVLAFALIAIFFWNSQNTLHANNRVATEMAYLDRPYYDIKAFLAEDPEAYVFLDHVPFNKKRFFLGSDIALEQLIDERLTRFVPRATHIYNGKTFVKNLAYRGYELPTELRDFSVSWAYLGSGKTPAWLDVVVVGSSTNYPRISVTQGGYVVVDMLNISTGKVDSYSLKHPYATIPGQNSYSGWALMKVIRDGGRLCLYFNGSLVDTVSVKGSYRQWTADASGLHGSYYLGKGGASYVSNLFIEGENNALACD